MSDRQAETFEVCLSAMENGADLERCLSLFPDLSPELRPALETARLARLIGEETVPNAALQRSRARLLRKAAGLQERSHPRKASFLRLAGLQRIVLAALVFALVLVTGWQGIFVASAKALPGDPLYPVKRAVENLSLSLRPENEARRAVEAHYEQRRAGEVLGLLALGRAVDVRFTGVVDEISSKRWTVDDIPVLIAPQTEVTGAIELGMVVEVSGQTRPEGLVAAAEVRLHSYEFVGKVEEIGRSVWIISGTELRVLPSSQLDPGVRVGDQVLVLVETSEGEPPHALAILRLLQPALLPTVLSTQEPEEGRTPEPPSQTEIEFGGRVESISSNIWRIGGREVLIEAGTEIRGEIAVGDFVTVRALAGSDGSLAAREIQLRTSNPGAATESSKEAGGEGDSGGQNTPAGSSQGGSNSGDNESGDHSQEEDDSAEDHDRNDGGSGSEPRDHPQDNDSGDEQNEDDPHDEDHNGGDDQDHDSSDPGENENHHGDGGDGDQDSENGD